MVSHRCCGNGRRGPWTTWQVGGQATALGLVTWLGLPQPGRPLKTSTVIIKTFGINISILLDKTHVVCLLHWVIRSLRFLLHFAACVVACLGSSCFLFYFYTIACPIALLPQLLKHNCGTAKIGPCAQPISQVCGCGNATEGGRQSRID